MVGSTFPQRRRGECRVVHGIDDRAPVGRRAAPRGTAECHGAVVIRCREPPGRVGPRRGLEPEGAGAGRQDALAPGRRGRELDAVECDIGPLGDHVHVRDRIGWLDDELERSEFDRSNVEFVGVRTPPRAEPVAAGSEPHHAACAVAGDLGDVDIGDRDGRRKRWFCRHDRSDQQLDIIEQRRRVDGTVVDECQPRNRLTGDSGNDITEGGRRRVGVDRDVGVTMGGTHDDFHWGEHYGT